MNFEEDLTLFVRHTYTIWHKTRTGNDLVGQEFTYKDALKEINSLSKRMRTTPRHFKITYSVSISAVTPELELDQTPDIKAITQWIWKQFQTTPPNPHHLTRLQPPLHTRQATHKGEHILTPTHTTPYTT